MDKAVTKLRSRLEPKSDGGFKFAITLITVCISVLFFIHNYAENNLIPFLSVNYLILSSLIALSIILLLYIGSYILFKGISLEVKDSEKRKTYENTATDFYVEAFIVAIYLILGILFEQLWNLPYHIGVFISSIPFSYIITFRLDVFEPMIDPMENEPSPRLKRLLLPLLTFKSLLLERYPKLKHELSVKRFKSLLRNDKYVISSFSAIDIIFDNNLVKWKVEAISEPSFKDSPIIKKYEESKLKPLTIELLILNIFLLILDIFFMVQIFYPICNWNNQIINSTIFFIICTALIYTYSFIIIWYTKLKPLTLELQIFKFFLLILRIIIMIQILLLMFLISAKYSHTGIDFLITIACFFVIYHYIARWEILKPLELAYFYKIKYMQFFLILGLLVTTLTLPSILSGHLKVEMNSIYHRQDQQIPVDISVTGFRNNSSGVFVDLYQTNSTNIVQTDSLDMQHNSSLSEGFSGIYPTTYLYGSEIGLGSYRVFINCSNLTEGYYELSVISGVDFKNRTVEPPFIDKYLYNNNERVNLSFFLIDGNKSYTPK